MKIFYLIITQFIVSTTFTTLYCQSWLSGRCLRVNEPKVERITAYIIPCSKEDTLQSYFTLDSTAYIRGIEIFNDKGQLIESSNNQSYNSSLITTIYEYKNDILVRKFKIIESDTIEVILHEHEDIGDGIVKTTTTNLNNLMSSSFFTHKNRQGQVTMQYSLYNDNDTTNIRHFIYDENKNIISITSYFDGNRYMKILIRNDEGQTKQVLFIDPSGEVEKIWVNKTIIVGEEQINTLNDSTNSKIKLIYYKILDVHGNVERLIIKNSDFECLTTWYYKIDYKD